MRFSARGAGLATCLMIRQYPTPPKMYALAWVVLSDTNMASKFENGVAPPETDIGGIQVVVILSIIAAVAAVVSAMMANVIRSTLFTKVIVVLCFVAIAPFALITLITVGLAF